MEQKNTMTRSGRRVHVLLVIVLVTVAGVMGTAQQQSAAVERPPFGPVIISPYMGSWDDYQRPIIRSSEFTLAKVHLPAGFGNRPDHVVDLIEDGIEVIMLKTEDCRTDAMTTYNYMVDGGFLDVVQQYPEVDFVVQVGNEPELCPVPMNKYVNHLYDVITVLKPGVDQPNLRWVAGLPMNPETAKALLDDGWIQRLYDGVGTNMLGHYSLTNEYHNWHEIVDYVLDETDTDIWITEIGINHPPMDKAIKAERILEYIDTLPADRVGGIAVFTLGQGTEWPQYEITQSMVPVFAGREDCHFYSATGEFLCGPFKKYWEEYGGLAIFGYPITSEDPGGNGETVQFFERSRFEWHPGVWPEQHDVLLGHLGRELIQGRRAERPFQSAARSPQPGDDCVYFEATRHHLCDEFLEYWNEFGGLPIFGYPLSQPFVEDGHLVQYFERARLEYQPGVWPERFDVLQGLLGVQAVQDEESR
jgi:hypothetical protein